MKQFEIPSYFRSPIISKVKAKMKLQDPRKQDFTPTSLKLGNVEFIISRHFGFCYGVENAIEKSYDAIQNNPEKRIFLLSQMIHNPEVNEDLVSQGVRFIQDTSGNQIIPWDEITSEDIVIIPAFGTTTETFDLLKSKQIDVTKYNTTCPFVEKVWNRSAKLGAIDYTIIIHGKYNHEETKATFSHSYANAPSLVIKNIEEAQELIAFINNERTSGQFYDYFSGKYSKGFDPEKDLQRIGVVNQTTMLASETQEISELLRLSVAKKFGIENIKEHYADTRDTLCYATNDNQNATLSLLEQDADIAIVVGGYNSSNTSHLVELLEPKFRTFFIKNKDEIKSMSNITNFDIHSSKVIESNSFIPQKENLKVIITSGASCPDSAVDQVIQKVLLITGNDIDFNTIEL